MKRNSAVQSLIPFKKQKTSLDQDASSSTTNESEKEEIKLFEDSEIKTQELTQAKILFCKNFLSAEFAQRLFDYLESLTFTQSTIKIYGKEINTPRLQRWMSDEGVDARLYQKNKAIPWTNDMLLLKEKLEEITNFKFNYVLLNLYRDGKDKIAYHSDGEAIGENKNVVASISLGATRKFVLRHKKWKEDSIPKEEYLLNHGSLLVMVGDDCQKYWKHTVPPTKKVVTKRYNLTFRHN